MKYLLGVDVGTTSLKAAVFDENANRIMTLTKDYTLNVSGDFVEFPADGYWQMLQEVLEEVSPRFDLYAMSIDTQCETLILADEEGNPLADAVVWLDNRAAKQADELRSVFGEKKVYEVTGQPEITATWPACKLLWFRRERPEIFRKMKKVFLLEDYLLWKLTGRFITEQTLQSSSVYFDIHRRIWWQEMLDFLGLTESCLPSVLKSGEVVGEYRGIKVVTGAMDQVAGAIGAGVVEKGIVSEMTGTTMAAFVPTDTVPAYRADSKIPCHLNYDGSYALLLWSSTAGIALKWFRNQFCESFDFKELDALAEQVPPGSAGLTFLPYLCGSTMPKYDPEARGVFYGLTLEHTRGHAVRSILESVACMLKRNLDYINVDYSEVRTMGGGAQSPLWCRIKADMTGKTFVTLKSDETACLGSAILAGVATGVFESVPAACAMAVKPNRVYRPGGDDYSECYARYLNIDDKIFG